MNRKETNDDAIRKGEPPYFSNTTRGADSTSGVDAMNDAQGFPVKKAFLYALIGSVGLSAFLGILAILSGRFGWFEIRILLTTATIAAASICGLACGAYLATRRGQTLPFAGVALTLLAAAMIIVGVWTEINSEAYWKLAASASVFSVACAHLALLSMALIQKWPSVALWRKAPCG